MASINPYPSGSDIIAPLPLFTPDFGMMNSMLQRRASMFEQGLSQVKSSDSLIRNAALSVSDNQVVRDQYIKQAEEQLKKLEGADFSQLQNVEAAQQIYAPFWQDQELLMDYSKTSAINAERTRAESMAQSSDPKVREQFWKKGLDYVNLAANDLSMAKRGDGSIGKVRVNKFVPFFDVMEELKKRAKDQGLQIEIDSQEGPNKAYKITRINGDGAVPLFKEWAANELSTMPQADDMFRVEGAVDFRTGVQNLLMQGYDELGARRALAERYMNQQKDYYNGRFTEMSSAVTEMTKKLDALDIENKAKLQKGMLTAEDVAARKELARQLEAYKNTTTSLQESVDRFSKPDSKEYQDQYNTIVEGGENFFSNHYRDRLINNFARNQAINSKYKIEVDPVYKLNLELQKEMTKLQLDAEQFQMRYGSGGGGTKGSSSTGSKAKDGNPLDNPIYVGRSIMGNDPVAAQQRLTEYYGRVADEYLNTGASIINEAGMLDTSKMVSPAYQNYLKEVLKTGKYTPSEELKAEHKRLQDAGVIPKDQALGQSPSAIYNSLYDRAIDLLAAGAKAGSVNQNVFQRIQAHARQAQNFMKLRDLRNEVEQRAAADPAFKGLMKDGKLMSLADYMKANLGYTSKEAYVRNTTANVANEPMPATGGVSIRGMIPKARVASAEDRWEKVEEQYNKAYGLIKDKVATMMQRYIGVEGSVIGQEIELATDRKEDRELAQNIAVQAMSTTNMANQVVDKDGSGYPMNIEQLEKLGADRDKIKQLMDLTRGNIDNFIDKVRLTKVGITGKPTVRIIYNIDEVKKLLGEKAFNTEDWQSTLKTLSSGLEIAVDQAQIDGFSQDFDLPGASDITFDRNQMVKAPDAVKRFGFDYTILKDPSQRQYIINFQYQENGIPKQRNMYVPLDQSLTSVQTMLEQTMYQLYTGNQQSLQKQGSSGNFISPNTDYQSLIR